MRIRTEGRWLKDEQGRTLLLRGVNLGGSSKVPTRPDGATWRREGFFHHRDVSFVGRPFPLEESDEHFGRLRAWGLTLLRFVITWEAVEHAGPGRYDEEYLDYLYAVVKRAGDYDLTVWIDPHQDVWSRFSGGDGAPGWTLEAVGMDMTRFRATGAAVTHQELGDPYPRMLWPSNYARYACATMFTLFFGGSDFAPETRVEGIPVQEYLQGHYLGAVRQVAERVSGLPQVVGYDTLNEPSQGYIGQPDLRRAAGGLAAEGVVPTILQGMLLAAGQPQEVEVSSRLPVPPWRRKRVRVNPEGISLWRAGCRPIWQANGVWDLDRAGQPHLLRPDHFCRVGTRRVDFGSGYFIPFVERYTREVRAVHPEALIFVSPPPSELQFGSSEYLPDGLPGLVYAPHWYDGVTLYLQRSIPWLGVDTEGGRLRFVVGRERKRRAFAQQVRNHAERAGTASAPRPTVIGETGIAMNLDGKRGYRSGDFSVQVAAMDDTMQAMEANLLGVTVWNYTADNSNQRGDQWNDEDLSIFSPDQQTGSDDPEDGGRCLEAVVRPYARAVPGEPLRTWYDRRTRTFEFEFRLDPGVEAPAEFFLPAFRFAEGVTIQAPGGRHELDAVGQCLRYFPDPGQSYHRLRITPGGSARV